MRSKVFWMAVWLVLGATALAQRTYLEAGTRADMQFSFAQQTAFALAAVVDAGVRDLAGPFGVGGRFGIGVFQGGAAFELGLSGLFHFGKYGAGLSPLAGLGFRVFFGGGQTTFGLNGAAGIEYFVNRQVAFVARAEPTLWFAGGTSFGLDLRAGLRVYP
ncbi:MAG: hypothetical protein ACP5JV_06945 [Thermus sp.]|uniref:hypothetical protein n=1 Tax=Thermus sp. TaxID=275 RepID=UPI003D146EA4